ncbi:mitochondrial mRNA pseudouridine synthase RPUSD3 isoform X1 [Ursus americanus]|uniref:Mitochondrial mRNA pseudouridine synthase RPUSD3 isoform X1 n=1 Tax=Ursus maritimus TaxID=29073 RepID=A0A384CMR2_URSMA|nr:mitochondrial mRNA pseudouridine synthase RPUSD3 isoform X1 [Ursus maritimus]XP_026357113.1 mitochondrial mRNA pseudouridine synthase RPUSD3 isoform X1 [Ursus arctos]XP_045664157.1 mitochondrial mRNA pseudouridine synthase RPUSD3 isoform X1 [Ursus americanus]
MRTVPAREMGVSRILGHVWGGWRWGPGVLAAPKAAGFGTEARHQLRRRGSSKRSGPLGDQPFPGLLQLENLSREGLVDVLRAAVVDQKGPLVTLNKPPGLPVTGKPGEPTLCSVLPELSQSLGLRDRELQIVQASGKETSGLVLLSSCPQTASRLQKFFIHSRRAQRPTATYCAVTDGIPATSEGNIQAALKLEHVDGVDLVIPVKSPSRKDFQEGVKRTLSHFHVVAMGSGCALVQLQPLTVFPSQLQVHMVLQLCPVLGDHTYSARVGTVLGQRFLLPAESTKPQRQVLDGALIRRLCLSPAQSAQLPLHLHLHCLHLPGLRPREAPMKLLAPLPPYFSRTLQCLGLHQQ